MELLGVKIDGYNKVQLRALLSEKLKKRNITKISKINTEFLHRALKDQEFLNVLQLSDVNLVDGYGVLWAARYLTLPLHTGLLFRKFECVWQMIYSSFLIIFSPKFITKPIPEVFPGVEAFKSIMKIASERKVGVFLFGGSESVIIEATKNIKKEFPDLIISGTLNGYDYQKDNKINVIDVINKTDAKILIVGLGSPKQEYWINDNIDKLKNIIIAVGEGGTLDRIADPSQKAPKFINRIGLEWLWRLLFNKSKTESRNRFQRFWNSVPVFMYQTVKWKIKYGQTKITN